MSVSPERSDPTRGVPYISPLHALFLSLRAGVAQLPKHSPKNATYEAKDYDQDPEDRPALLFVYL